MKLSTALLLSATLVNACNAERSLEADVHSCACEAIEFEFEIDCENIATVSGETVAKRSMLMCTAAYRV